MDIPGARSSTYTAQAGDVDSQLRVRVSFTDDKGNPETLTSNATEAVVVAQVTVRFGTKRLQRDGGRRVGQGNGHSGQGPTS